MYCKKCGSKFEDGEDFCSQCGYKKNNVKHVDSDYEIEKPSGAATGLSITGMIFGIIATILSVILLILLLNEDNLNGRYFVTFLVLGIMSGLFFIIGLILSIIGTTKRGNFFGILGIITSVASLIIDIISLVYVFNLMFFD